MELESPQHWFLNSLWTKFSSLHTLVRVTAWIRRFTLNSTSGSTRITSDILTSAELKESKQLLIRLAQLQSFPEVFNSIKENKSLPKSHALYKTANKMEEGHLVIHSRVRNASNPSTPHRLIPLHAKSPFTKLLGRSTLPTHTCWSLCPSLHFGTYVLRTQSAQSPQVHQPHLCPLPKGIRLPSPSPEGSTSE